MFHMHFPKLFWGHAVLTTCYLINRLPSSLLQGMSLFSILYPTHFPFSLPLRVFGCVCFVQSFRPGLDKLDPRAEKYVFVGYSRTQKRYRCYSPSLRRVFVSADVTFFEDQSYYAGSSTPAKASATSECVLLALPSRSQAVSSLPAKSSTGFQFAEHTYHQRGMTPTVVHPSSTHDSSVPSSVVVSFPNPPIVVRKGTRSCVGQPIDRFSPPSCLSTCLHTRHPLSNFLSYDCLCPTFSAFVSFVYFISIPRTVVEAVAHPGWKQAMKDEMHALIQN